MTTQKNKIIAITGPTATGKTEFAIKLASELDTEIISADSRLVYRGFDIASAKPTIGEMRGIKHHLIDIVEPEVDYSVANFYDDAKVVIDGLLKKGKTPIVVGGTGLYFRILLEDFDLPRVKPDFSLREELDKKDSKDLHDMLMKLDEKSAQKIHFNNKVKIIRALEVCIKTGKPMSEVAGKKEHEFDVKWIGLNYKDRKKLYKRIEDRVDEMLEKGLVDETKNLLKKHGRINNFINTIGYKEMLEYIDGITGLDEAVDELKKNSRRYAKRQISWFKRNQNIEWIEK